MSTPKSIFALIREWREPTSLHPYRDEKKCAAELETLLLEWDRRLEEMWSLESGVIQIGSVQKRILGTQEGRERPASEGEAGK